MSLNFENTNEIWAYVLTETLKRLGLNCVVICPGSRSTPLTVAFAKPSLDIEAIPILDERSAAFFALGRAKATGKPVALVCTSGTAGANFYPAVIEAKESRVPLLIFTADRPNELRDCHSGQTIDQLKLYGSYPNWQGELATPGAEMEMLGYLRQVLVYAFERSLYPVKGPVHLNVPLRDPLAPIDDGVDLSHLQQLNPEDFFAHINDATSPNSLSSSTIPYSQLPFSQFQRGIIIAGVSQPKNPYIYSEAIGKLASYLGFPVLAEGLSPVRNYADLNPYIVSSYDLILRNQQFAEELVPEIVIQIGEMPTSKVLRTWLQKTQPIFFIIDPSDQNLDPLHGKTTHLRFSIESLFTSSSNISSSISPSTSVSTSPLTPYLQRWLKLEIGVRNQVDKKMEDMDLHFEGKAAWLLSQILPESTPFFIANSMPVRDVEFFWKPNTLRVRSHFNRGANGIDGTLSTALGIAHRNQSSVMLTGDLALLHDTNGFLIGKKFIGHLTIVLINNNGGGIFGMLPIAKFEPPFEEFFATPQDIDFCQLCATYSVEHELIKNWQQLEQRLNQLPKTGIRVLELQTNRQADARWRQENLGKFTITP
jgi:2-succinyl-5-enolpyruvyl-6-hydroxy-3-cyclohexene-1-carboxylate synthase